MRDRRCFAEYFTETDIEDFRNIARLYANFSKSPTLLAGIGQRTDNIFPRQYMASIGGTRPGRIKLIDLDNLFECKIGRNQRFCTYENVLNVNCQIMAMLTGIPNLNCSLPSPTTTKAVSYSPNDRINASHAATECKKRNNHARFDYALYDRQEEYTYFFWDGPAVHKRDWREVDWMNLRMVDANGDE